MNPNATIDEILNFKGSAVWSIAPNATVLSALKLMAEKNVGALVVIEGEKLVGILTERDYARKVVLKGLASKDTPVKAILSDVVIHVPPTHSVEDCMRLMTEHRVRHLPVVEAGKILGIISIGDLVNWIISAQNSTIHQLQTYITGYPG
ncbi:MAG: histidine kinase [Verrucomicrobia bacterium]|nr:MAG: histidine kinase [Verrucomicrobiota bacterium]